MTHGPHLSIDTIRQSIHSGVQAQECFNFVKTCGRARWSCCCNRRRFPDRLSIQEKPSARSRFCARGAALAVSAVPATAQDQAGSARPRGFRHEERLPPERSVCDHDRLGRVPRRPNVIPAASAFRNAWLHPGLCTAGAGSPCAGKAPMPQCRWDCSECPTEVTIDPDDCRRPAPEVVSGVVISRAQARSFGRRLARAG